MSERGLRGQTLAFAAVVEIGTGVLLMLQPTLVAQLLLGDAVTGTGTNYYLLGNTWFKPAYGANGVYYVVVPAP